MMPLLVIFFRIYFLGGKWKEVNVDIDGTRLRAIMGPTSSGRKGR